MLAVGPVIDDEMRASALKLRRLSLLIGFFGALIHNYLPFSHAQRGLVRMRASKIALLLIRRLLPLPTSSILVLLLGCRRREFYRGPLNFFRPCAAC